MKEYAALQLDELDRGYISPRFSHHSGSARWSYESRNVFSKKLQTMLEFGWTVSAQAIATQVTFPGNQNGPTFHFLLEREVTAEPPEMTTEPPDTQ